MHRGPDESGCFEESHSPMKPKAVAMISGGLDSTLAARIVLEEGVELCGVYLSAPWGCCDKTKALKVASLLQIDFMVIQMEKDYIDVIRHPRYGYGSSMNPCVDCRIYMFKKVKELMASIGASFLVTGEVLGQRPMSQMRHALSLIEQQAGLDRCVLRPLSAKLLPITIPEEKGWVDRNRLYDICGRSRKRQMELALRYGILDYPTPAGGCLLTDRQFGERVRDLFEYQEEIDLTDMELLRIGRHFRIGKESKLIVGRNEAENRTLQTYLAEGRVLIEPVNFPGPSVLLIGTLEEEARQWALRLIRHHTPTHKLPLQPKVRIQMPFDGRIGGEACQEEVVPLTELDLETEAIDARRIG